MNIKELLKFHKSHGKIATVTSINIGQKFGVLVTDNDNFVRAFREKRESDGSWVNGGYMVLNPEVFNYIPEGDEIVFEQTPLEKLSKDGELVAYKYNGFWQCMDTQRDKMKLEELWKTGNAPWKVW